MLSLFLRVCRPELFPDFNVRLSSGSFHVYLNVFIYLYIGQATLTDNNPEQTNSTAPNKPMLCCKSAWLLLSQMNMLAALEFIYFFLFELDRNVNDRDSKVYSYFFIFRHTVRHSFFIYLIKSSLDCCRSM